MYVLDRGFQVGGPRLSCMHTQDYSLQLPWEESAVSATCVKAQELLNFFRGADHQPIQTYMWKC